ATAQATGNAGATTLTELQQASGFFEQRIRLLEQQIDQRMADLNEHHQQSHIPDDALLLSLEDRLTSLQTTYTNIVSVLANNGPTSATHSPAQSAGPAGYGLQVSGNRTKNLAFAEVIALVL